MKIVKIKGIQQKTPAHLSVLDDSVKLLNYCGIGSGGPLRGISRYLYTFICAQDSETNLPLSHLK
jgi:hypothetical protein